MINRDDLKLYQDKADKLGIGGITYCPEHSEPTSGCSDCEFRFESAVKRITFNENQPN